MANKYRAWASGEVLTSANLIDFIQKNVLIPCDSSADYPDSTIRRQGMAVYDKTLNKLLVYTTATTGWVPPWNLPWGIVPATAGGTSSNGYVRVTTAQNGVGTTLTAVTNATVTFTAVANRLYRITAQVPVVQATGATRAQVNVLDGATTIAASSVNNLLGSAVSLNNQLLAVTTVTTLSAGSHTVSLSVACETGTINLPSSATVPTVLSIEDAGPVGAPTA